MARVRSGREEAKTRSEVDRAECTSVWRSHDRSRSLKWKHTGIYGPEAVQEVLCAGSWSWCQQSQHHQEGQSYQVVGAVVYSGIKKGGTEHHGVLPGPK